MTPRQEQEQRTNAAFRKAQKRQKGTPTERQVAEAAQSAAFKRAVASRPARKAKAKSELFGRDWDKAVANATPAERREAARKLAALNNPKPGACRMVTRPTVRTAMLGK